MRAYKAVGWAWALVYAFPMASAGLLALSPSSAQAQAGAKSVLEEVLVTARRREENLQEVPDTVVSIPSETIERANITMVRDVTARIPNVSIEESLSPTSTFLGVRGVVSTRNGEPAVAMVVDGVQTGSASEISQAFHDVESIEVLKGPQGALYGRNAIGGAILINTKTPTDELQGRVTAGYGNGNMMEFNGAIAGPITDNLKFRVSGFFRDMEGTITNEFLEEQADGANITAALDLAADEDSYADFELNKDLRGRLLWEPLETTAFDLRINYSDLEVGSYWYKPTFRLNDSTLSFPIGNDVNTVAHRDLINVSLKIEHEIAAGTLTSISAYTSTEERYGIPFEGRGSNRMGDVDFTNDVFLNRALPTLSASDRALFDPPIASGFFPNVGSHNFYDVENFMQEVRFTSDSSRRLRWVAGAFALWTDRKDTIRADFVPRGATGTDALPLAARLPNGLPGPTDFATVAGLLLETSNTQDNVAWAFFGNIDFDLTDSLTLTAALRYDEDNREITRLDGPTVDTNGTGIGAFGADCTAGVDPGCVPKGFVEEETFNAWQPKVSLAWQTTDDAMMYVTYARGFRSGGFNATGATLTEVYDKEILDNFEIGTKTTWFDGRLRVNAATFYQDYDDVQVFEFDGNIFVQSLFNIPESEIYGFEASFDWVPHDTLTISGGFGILESEIKQFDPFVSSTIESELKRTITNDVKIAPDAQAEFDDNFKGNKLPKFPHQTFNLSLLHELPVAMFGNSTLDYRGFNDRYWWVDNTDVQGFEHIFDASIALQLTDRWETAFWCKNCTDNDYNLSFEPAEMTIFGGPSKDIEYVARGVTYGMQIKYKF